MTVVISGTTGITNDGGYTGDGVVFADTTPANTLVTTTGGNVGVGTSLPTLNTNGTVLHINNSTASRAAIIHMTNAESGSTSADGLICGKWSDGTNYFFDYDSNPIVFGTGGTERARIDSNGRVTTPFQPAFRAIATTSVNYNTAGTKITVHDTTTFNIGNHYNTATQRFTAPVAGIYIFTARAWANIGNTASAGIQFLKNGATNGTLRIGSSRDGYSTLQPMTYLSLAVGDYVELFTEDCSATGIVHTSSGEANSMFAGYFLG